MNKLFFFIGILILPISTISGQKYFTKTGSVIFLSKAPLENIEASNNSSYVVYDAASGKIEWSVLIKGFKFEKSLMQEHFNENYMESDKYPKAIFKGDVTNYEAANLAKDDTYPVSVNGQMTIHGITKPFSTRATIVVKSGNVHAESAFDIVIADFNIEVPKVVRDNIAKTVSVKVKADLQPLVK